MELKTSPSITKLARKLSRSSEKTLTRFSTWLHQKINSNSETIHRLNAFISRHRSSNRIKPWWRRCPIDSGLMISILMLCLLFRFWMQIQIHRLWIRLIWGHQKVECGKTSLHNHLQDLRQCPHINLLKDCKRLWVRNKEYNIDNLYQIHPKEMLRCLPIQLR